ncbi:cocaine- and amphetamine-regulated transcript protein [Astyanax mexicanus]|uniref:Cocaine- and amphetamine-regulated transcript protein-like n=1 Tax=Astyanax mexicanus TaxID=7994 RepID=A0A8B9RCZ7_ASTMX|nr:cocaine- and amphetamine-regulated transcript protein [Astyanax mexicanus]KAG9279819.1 cocaine- and amphetamine-regulated transcript protein-like [Astyanax mexicanus]
MVNVTLLFVVCVVLCVVRVGARPPENLPLGPMEADDSKSELTKSPQGNLHTGSKKKLNRLPGVCRRLKRRRITILCNVEKYCSALRYSQHGHVCPCPKTSRCTHFYLKSF